MRPAAGQRKKNGETSNEGDLLHGRSIAGAGWEQRDSGLNGGGRQDRSPLLC
jgi:hypothetical protein